MNVMSYQPTTDGSQSIFDMIKAVYTNIQYATHMCFPISFI